MGGCATARVGVTSVLVCVVVLATSGAATARREKKPPREEPINYQLGPRYARWLVGPLYLMATSAERDEFLSLSDDRAAATFVEEFWRRRDPHPELFGNEVESLYERRAEQADRRFREGTRLGRATDRGTVFVLYGEPARIDFDPGLSPREPDLEVWSYPEGAAPGLDGEPPKQRYYFAERNGETVLFTPRATRRSLIQH